MKLARQLSQTSVQATPVLIERILTIVTQKKYGIKKVSANNVSFDKDSYTGRGSGSRYQNFVKLHNGTFKITDNGEYRMVEFSYLLFERYEIGFVLCLVMIFTTFAIYTGSYAFLISVAFIIQQTIKYYNLKVVAKEMFDEVLK